MEDVTYEAISSRIQKAIEERSEEYLKTSEEAREAEGHDLDELFAAIKDLYWQLDEDEPDVEGMEDLGDLAITALWDDRKTVMGILEAARKLKSLLEGEIARKLGPAGVARLDDFQVKLRTDRKLRIADVEAFVEWVADDWTEVFNLTGTNVRVKALRAIAQRRGLDPDHAIDTFCEYDEGDRKLATVPLDRVGQKWAKLKHGETENASAP